MIVAILSIPMLGHIDSNILCLSISNVLTKLLIYTPSI